MSVGDRCRNRQALSLVKLLGLEPVIKNIQPSASIQWIFPTLQLKFLQDTSTALSNPNRLSTLPWYLTSPNGDTLDGEAPAVVISSCADTILPALLVKKLSEGKSKAIHLQDPLVDVIHFDACLIPKHFWPTIGLTAADEIKLGVYRTDGILNPITREYLNTVSIEHISESFRNLEADRVIAVLVSGETTNLFAWYSDHSNRLIRHFEQLLTIHNVKMMLSFSDRTPETVRTRLMTWHSKLKPDLQSRVLCLKDQDSDQYNSALALSTDVLVFSDSPMLTTEAICSGRRVYLVGFTSTLGTLREFHQAHILAKRVRIFKPSQWEVEPEDQEDVLCEGAEFHNGFGGGDPEKDGGQCNVLPEAYLISNRNSVARLWGVAEFIKCVLGTKSP
ncbi:hypothetical protein BDV3_007333 [Batrachochytrium dendrobatidis]